MENESLFTSVNAKNSYQLPFAAYHKMLYHYCKIGEFHVLGLGIIESLSQIDNRKTLSSNLNQEVVKKALDYLVWRHPLLRAHVICDGSKSDESDPFDSDFRLVISNQKDLLDAENSKHLDWQVIASRTELTAVLEEFNSIPYEYDAKNSKQTRLWRLRVIEFQEDAKTKYALAFSIPLFICDGLCISALLVELTNIVNSILLDQTCEEMQKRLELADDNFSIVKKCGLMDEEKMKHLEEMRDRPMPNCRLPEKFRENSAERGCKISMFRVDAETTKKVVEFCKEHKQKMTGYLSAVLIYALEELYAENGCKFHDEFIFGISTNLRMRIEPKIETFHLRTFSAFCKSELIAPLSPDIKESTAYLNSIIQASTDLKSGRLFHYSFDKKYIEHALNIFENSSSDAEACQLLAEDLNYDLILSNCGRFVQDEKKLCPHEPWLLRELFFCESTTEFSQMEPTLTMHCSYWQDELMFALSSNKAGMNAVYIDRFVELIQKRFKSLTA